MRFDRLELDRPSMIKMLSAQMKSLHEEGGEDVQRVKRELDSDPSDPTSWFDLGMAYGNAAMVYRDMAVECEMFEYMEQHPDEELDPNRTVVLDLPQVADLYENALKAFDKVEELCPDYYGLNCQRGWVYANMRKYDLAERALLQAMKDDDEDFVAAHSLAELYHDMGDESKAAHYQSIADQLAPEGEPSCGCM